MIGVSREAYEHLRRAFVGRPVPENDFDRERYLTEVEAEMAAAGFPGQATVYEVEGRHRLHYVLKPQPETIRVEIKRAAP